ncbi:MAG: dienelactone hydrolase [Gammaproteobacteria bacterium]|nr:dienelactone hydrolase [Gammaproteobacteria bacterium]MBM4233628.1 dienelactone hydrolase [Gammaproteobacteria bacterium]
MIRLPKFFVMLTVLLSVVSRAIAADLQICEAVLTDPDRDDRNVPVRVRLPAGDASVPIVIFSHGLGGSLDAGTRWAEAWTRAGIAVIHIQHVGSDESLWRGRARSDIGSSLRGAMSAEQLLARFADAAFVLDRVERRETLGGCSVQRLDRERIGVAGHSFGAHTALGVAGQRFPIAVQPRGAADPRVRAAIAFSPAPPASGKDADAFGDIVIPVLSITGTEDGSPPLIASVRPLTPADRERPYKAMRPGSKYLLVLDGADHMVFSGNIQRRRASDNAERVSNIVDDVTTRFWRSTLFADIPVVLERPRSLSGVDRWEAK